MSELENIKLIVELTKTKVDILKLKADDYVWACMVDDDTKEKLLATLNKIDALLSKLDI